MSFVAALPANTVKFSYVTLAKTILASDSGLGTDAISIREFVLSDSSTGSELLTYLERLLTDSGLGSELAKLVLQAIDSGVGYEKAVTEVIAVIHKIIKAVDSATGIDLRDRREACITAFGITLCKILPDDIIKPEDHNNPVNAVRNLLNELVKVKNKLDSVKESVGG